MEYYTLSEEALRNINDNIEKLESLLTERIRDLHQVKGGIPSRHNYLYYRGLLWDIKYGLENSLQETTPTVKARPELLKGENEKPAEPKIIDGSKDSCRIIITNNHTNETIDIYAEESDTGDIIYKFPEIKNLSNDDTKNIHVRIANLLTKFN